MDATWLHEDGSTYQILLNLPDIYLIHCKLCGMTSFNQNDVNQKYCANCKLFHNPVERSIDKMEDKDLNPEQSPLHDDEPNSEADKGGGHIWFPEYGDQTKVDFRHRHDYPLEVRSIAIWTDPDLDLNAYNSFGSRLITRIGEILVDFHMNTRKPGNLEQEWENDYFLVTLYPRHGGDYQSLAIRTKDMFGVPQIENFSRRIFNTLAKDGYTLTQRDQNNNQQSYVIKP